MQKNSNFHPIVLVQNLLFPWKQFFLATYTWISFRKSQNVSDLIPIHSSYLKIQEWGVLTSTLLPPAGIGLRPALTEGGFLLSTYGFHSTVGTFYSALWSIFITFEGFTTFVVNYYFCGFNMDPFQIKIFLSWPYLYSYNESQENK